MTSARLRRFLILFTIVCSIHPALAQDTADSPRVRGLDAAASELIRDLVARSATGRDLVDQLERSDLVVYVRRRLFNTALLTGRIGFVARDCRRRVVAIEIASPRSHVDELSALGHELQHAVEIAAEPTTCDATSLAALYSRIGDPVERRAGLVDSFETQAAADASIRVRRELLQSAAEN